MWIWLAESLGFIEQLPPAYFETEELILKKKKCIKQNSKWLGSTIKDFHKVRTSEKESGQITMRENKNFQVTTNYEPTFPFFHDCLLQKYWCIGFLWHYSEWYKMRNFLMVKGLIMQWPFKLLMKFT